MTYSRNILSIFLLSILVTPGFSQTLEQRRTLLQLSEEYRVQWERQRSAADSLAAVLATPAFFELPDGRVRELQRFENGHPLYYQTENLNAAKTISSDRVWPGGIGGLSLTGAGITVGVWEISGIRTTHQEFGGRITYGDAGTTSIGQHATHVAGTLIAAGVNSNAKGMSYQANLRAFTASNDMSETAAAAAAGLRVSSHSYGIAPGWNSNYFGDGKWAWSGNLSVSTTVDYTFGFYSSLSSGFDNVAYNAPQYLIVKSAGNDRNDNGPSPETEHWHFSGGWILNSDTHAPDGGVNGYGCVSGVAVAKNVLVVGAVNDIAGGYSSPSSVVMTAFSAWGPTSDGRIKPDIVANGAGLTSSNSTDDNTYVSMSGTSMASPSAAGSVGLLLQHQQNLHGSTPLRSSSMKGIVIHTADEAGPNPGPDYMFGWGLMNTLKAAQVMTANALAGGNFNIREIQLNQGGVIEFQVEATGTEPLRATIVWTDPAGTPPTISLNPPNKMLVNDLDLRIIGPTATTFFPWILNPASPASAATTGDNNTDNVEQVHIAFPTPGLYTIRVTNKGSLLPSGSQFVSIIMTGATQPAASPPPIPTLATPSDGATAIITSPTLTWNSSVGAVSYRLQLSTDNAFGTTLIDQAAITSTSHTVMGLASQTLYYWRVRASNAAGESDWSSVWSFTTGIAPPVAPSLIVPNSDAVNVSTNPPFMWHTASGATSYQLQVSLSSAFSTTVVNQSNIMDSTSSVSGLQGNTMYYWRVRGSNAGGPGEWSATRSFTTVATPPSIPTLVSPENGSTDTPLNETLSWGASSNATSYRIQVATDSLFAGGMVLNDSTVVGTSRVLTGASNSTRYFWRVNAKNTQGVSSFSDVWSFTTVPGPPPAPQLASPGGGDTVRTGSPTLVWRASSGATEYRLQLSTQSQFNQIFFDRSEIRDTAFSISGLSATRYYWRVSASNEYGGSISTIRNFFVSAPLAPVLISPAAGATGIPVPVPFMWNASVGALTYRLQVATSSNFTPPSSIIKDSSGISGTSVQISGLSHNASYYWRVSATNELGSSSFSLSRSFTTAGPVSVERDPLLLPDRFALHQNFPNPFNPSTEIRFDISAASSVSLVVFDIFGREVASLVESELPAGRYRATFSADGLSSGVYFCQLRAGEYRFVRRMILMR
jgi:hypothetical protein